jgi:uncharacterized ubiquitin-like protein YukD
MKVILSFLFTILICQTASAQTVMSESELFGYWKAISVKGNMVNPPISVEFKQDGTCIYKDNRGTLACEAFIVSYPNKLHLLSSSNFDGYTHFTIINLTVDFDNYNNHDHKLILSPYSTTGISSSYYSDMVTLERGAPEGSKVKEITDNKLPSNTIHKIDGIVTESPQGIYIQDGKKMLKKR